MRDEYEIIGGEEVSSRAVVVAEVAIPSFDRDRVW